MTCPYLEYREASGERSFGVARGYCTAAERFVQPMRADICNDRYDLDHAEHCEVFIEHAPADGDVPDPGTPVDGRTDTGDGDDTVSDPAAANEAMPHSDDEATGVASRGEGATHDEDEEGPDP